MKMKKNDYRFFKKVGNSISTFRYWFRTLSFVKTILIFYLFITVIGALLLWLPVMQSGYLSWDPITGSKTKGNVGFIDSLFTSASAFSDTGLAVNSTAVTYNVAGQAVIAILIFVGGIGWFALKVYIFNIIFNIPLSYKARESLAAERGSVQTGVSRSLIRVVVTILLLAVFIFSIVLSLCFYYIDVSNNKNFVDGYIENNGMMSSKNLLYENPYHNPVVALRFGVFHTISAINNAGFDIIGNTSLSPYYHVVTIQVIFIILFVLGGLGYPVIYDVYNYFRTRYTGGRFKFSLFTKLSSVTYFLVSIFGLALTFGLEVSSGDDFWNDPNKRYGSTSMKSFALFFNTMSTRNAGFSTISMHELSRGVLIIYIVMMFIGSAPSSTAGGIRTTTIAITILGIWSLLRGRKNVYAFGKRIKQDTVNKSFIVFVTSVMILIIGSMISLTSLDTYGGKIPTLAYNVQQGKELMVGNPPKIITTFTYTEIVFEVGSAFGTTGLSTGLTPLLSLPTKLSLILIMFIGQLGVSSSILIWGSNKRNSENRFSRPTQDVSIG